MIKKEALILIGIFIVLTGIFLVAAVPGDNDNDGYNSSVDCNDSNSNVWSNTTVYTDNDADGYGSENSTVMCLGSLIPAGYSNVSSDCNDTNSSLWNLIYGYLDRDNDGYGEFNSIPFCALNLPAGHAPNNGDCMDVNQLVNPGATDICNGIDDDCDGNADEDFSDKGNVCYDGAGECRDSGEYICNKHENATFCNAIAKSPTIEICDGKDNDCDNSTDEGGVCDDNNISLVINLPQNGTYNTNRIQVNLSLVSVSGKKADKIIYIDNSQTKPKEIILCKNCNQHGVISKKSINLKDGEHNLLFKAIMNNGSEFVNLSSIFIDSRNPRLFLPRIRKKDYINGSFFINYDEDNLKSITLFYDNKNFTENNCSSGKKQVCMVKVNLSEFNGEDIFYSFLVKDISGNLMQTKNFSAEVDLTPPKINEISYPVVGSYVFFKFNITEKNFNDISYFDNSYEKAKWKILCSVLKNEICEKYIRLSPGEHNLSIRISDKAGNAVYVQV